ncbi:hypothetical protein ACQRIT_006358 [Beauveria bassiana]
MSGYHYLQSPGIPVHRVSEEFQLGCQNCALFTTTCYEFILWRRQRAMGLAAKAGLNANQVYDMIVSAAGHFYRIRNEGQEDARRGPGA